MENPTHAQSPAYGMPTVSTGQPAEPARIGPMGRLIGVLVSPGDTFADVNRKPTWLAPMLIAIIIGIATFAFTNWWAKPDYDRIIRKQAQASAERFGRPAPSEDVIAQQIKFGKIAAKVGVFVFPIIGVVLIDLLASLIFTLGLIAVQAKTTFKKILSVYAWTSCAIGLLSGILLAAVMLVRDRATLPELNPQDYATLTPTNLGAFLPSASPMIKSLAGSIDVISIWTIILLTIGFVAISGNKKITKGKAAIVVIVPWVFWILVKMGLASLGLFGS